MSAVISFFRPAPATQGDWSQQELAEFYRVEAALIRAGMQISSEQGLSDEADPWFVFCHPGGDAIIHFARIDGSYVVASDALDRPVRGPDFRALLNQIAEQYPALLPIPRSDAGAKLVVHPAALLAAIIAAAALLLSSEDAFADEIGHGGSAASSGEAGTGGLDPQAAEPSAPSKPRGPSEAQGQDDHRRQVEAVVFSAIIFAAQAFAADASHLGADLEQFLKGQASQVSHGIVPDDGSLPSMTAATAGRGEIPAVQSAASFNQGGLGGGHEAMSSSVPISTIALEQTRAEAALNGPAHRLPAAGPSPEASEGQSTDLRSTSGGSVGGAQGTPSADPGNAQATSDKATADRDVEVRRNAASNDPSEGQGRQDRHDGGSQVDKQGDSDANPAADFTPGAAERHAHPSSDTREAGDHPGAVDRNPDGSGRKAAATTHSSGETSALSPSESGSQENRITGQDGRGSGHHGAEAAAAPTHSSGETHARSQAVETGGGQEARSESGVDQSQAKNVVEAQGDHGQGAHRSDDPASNARATGDHGANETSARPSPPNERHADDSPTDADHAQAAAPHQSGGQRPETAPAPVASGADPEPHGNGDGSRTEPHHADTVPPPATAQHPPVSSTQPSPAGGAASPISARIDPDGNIVFAGNHDRPHLPASHPGPADVETHVDVGMVGLSSDKPHGHLPDFH